MKRLQYPLALGVLCLAIAGAWIATSQLQQTVPIVPGIQGCARLDGSVRQTDCLSRVFMTGASKAADHTTGNVRDERIIEYVRRADGLAADDADLAGLCHPAMHGLGRREGSAAADAERVPTFPGASSQLCTAGYVHGLAEGYLVGTPTADVPAVFPKLCHDREARSGCAHGVGHALVQAQPPAAVARTADAAVDNCTGLPHAHVTDCFDGVYMELALRPQIPVADYVRVCREAADVDRTLSCWGYLSLSISTNDVPLAEVPELCAKASLPGQFTCIDGYGRNLGTANVAQCSSSASLEQLRERCVEGAVGLQVGSGHVNRSEANAACRRIDDARLERHCLSAVKRYSKGRAMVERET